MGRKGKSRVEKDECWMLEVEVEGKEGNEGKGDEMLR